MTDGRRPQVRRVPQHLATSPPDSPLLHPSRIVRGTARRTSRRHTRRDRGRGRSSPRSERSPAYRARVVEMVGAAASRSVAARAPQRQTRGHGARRRRARKIGPPRVEPALQRSRSLGVANPDRARDAARNRSTGGRGVRGKEPGIVGIAVVMRVHDFDTAAEGEQRFVREALSSGRQIAPAPPSSAPPGRGPDGGRAQSSSVKARRSPRACAPRDCAPPPVPRAARETVRATAPERWATPSRAWDCVSTTTTSNRSGGYRDARAASRHAPSRGGRSRDERSRSPIARYASKTPSSMCRGARPTGTVTVRADWMVAEHDLEGAPAVVEGALDGVRPGVSASAATRHGRSRGSRRAEPAGSWPQRAHRSAVEAARGS